jgi:hypothetical protein
MACSTFDKPFVAEACEIAWCTTKSASLLAYLADLTDGKPDGKPDGVPFVFCMRFRCAFYDRH